jgi:cytochrome P450
MMAEDKDMANKLHTIAMKALNQGDKETALEESVFLKNFFMEALRLHPLAPALTGECTEDITLPFEGNEFGFPKGTTFLFFSFAMQRHKDYCKGSKGPDEIEPDRWDAASGQDQPFLHTFNNGPHACPGKPLSVLEGHIFLLQVASRFDFSFPEGVDRILYEEQMLLRPKDAMPLHVTRR